MSKKIQVYIPTPCHENWEVMTPVEKGRFCDSCQKQVMDFTRMSDREIAQFFKKPSTGSACGRFREDQLNRDIAIPRKRIPWVKYFFQFVLPAFLVSIKASTQAVRKLPEVTTFPDTLRTKSPRLGQALAGKVAGLTIYPSTSDQSCARIVLGKPSVQGRIIHGRIVDKTGDGISYASIVNKETGVRYQADVNGYFKIAFGMDWKVITFQLLSSGYYPSEVELDKASWEKSDMGNVLMNGKIDEYPDVVVSTGGIGIRRRPKELGFLNKKDTTVKAQTVSAILKLSLDHAKVFPNPIAKGGTLTIETISDKDSTLVVEIAGLDGHVVLSQSLKQVKGTNRFTLGMDSHWPAGIYFIQLLHENGKLLAREKIILQ